MRRALASAAARTATWAVCASPGPRAVWPRVNGGRARFASGQGEEAGDHAPSAPPPAGSSTSRMAPSWPITIALPEGVTCKCKEGGLLLFQGPLGTAKVPLRGPLVDKLGSSALPGGLKRRERMRVGPGGGSVRVSADGRVVRLDAEAAYFESPMRDAAERVQSGFIKTLSLTGTGFRWEGVTDRGGFEGEPPVGAGAGAPAMGANTRPTCTLVLTVGRSHTPRYTFPLDVIAWAESPTLLHIVSPSWESLTRVKKELIRVVGQSPYNAKGVAEVGDPPRVLRKGKKSGS